MRSKRTPRRAKPEAPATYEASLPGSNRTFNVPRDEANPRAWIEAQIRAEEAARPAPPPPAPEPSEALTALASLTSQVESLRADLDAARAENQQLAARLGEQGESFTQGLQQNARDLASLRKDLPRDWSGATSGLASAALAASQLSSTLNGTIEAAQLQARQEADRIVAEAAARAGEVMERIAMAERNHARRMAIAMGGEAVGGPPADAPVEGQG